MKIIIDTRGDIEMEVALKCVEKIVVDRKNDIREECIYTFLEPNAETRQVRRVVVWAKRNKTSITLRCEYLEGRNE